MTITIELPPDLEAKLVERARESGRDVAGFVQELVAREIGVSQRGKETVPSVADDEAPHARMTFNEILAPIRKGFAESGMTQAELDKLLQESLDEVRAERRGVPLRREPAV